MESGHAPESKWSLLTGADGLGLAALLVLIATAEAFDGARADIQAIARYGSPAAAGEATPDWLASRWLWVLWASAAVGIYVTVRAITIARALQPQDTGKLMRSLRWATPLFALAALAIWLWWQALGRTVVGGDYDVSGLGLRHDAAIGLAVAAVGLGGAVVGNATAATKRSALVRVQLVFLAAVYVLVFHAGFLSDQLTDVLRGWGDGPGAVIVSRPLAGLAAAVLLGAVVRASASRILLPETLAQPGAIRSPPPRVVAGLLVVAVVLSLLHFFAALAIAGLLVALLAVRIEPADPPPPPSPDLTRGLRRLAGTLGVVPLAILLGGLVAALVNSLLLLSGPSHTDIRLVIDTGIVTLAFAGLAAHSQVVEHPRFKWADDMRPELIGAGGLAIAMLSAVSPALSAVLLTVLAFVLALRLFGERGAVELWVAWGVGIGLAIAVYIRPIDVPRGLGGFAIALFGATAILALLHPLASLASRYRWRGIRHKRHVPVLLMLALWLNLAWWTAPVARNQVPTVTAAQSPQPLASAVGHWLDKVTAEPRTDRTYVPMVLVAASGGGSKAAYWTDLVLDCMVGDPPAKTDMDECPESDAPQDRYASLFLTSSVSGGSVGVYQLIHHPDVRGDQPWIKDSTGREVLSPLLAWGLAHDLPTFLLGAPTRPGWCGGWLSCRVNADRATVQAAAVAGTSDLRAVRTGDALTKNVLPVTVFNTTQVDRTDPVPTRPRRRVVLSRISLAEPRRECDRAAGQPIGDAIDGHDVLASDDDITMLSAALLSARFPFLEPPGWLGTRRTRSDEGCGGRSPHEQRAKLRDGGAYENTGMMTLVALLDPIKAGIAAWERQNHSVDVRIIVVSIDDDPPEIDPNPGLFRRLLGNTAGGRSETARDQACDDKSVSYMRISPRPHVGAQAATGWEISETSRREDLMDSLRPDQEAGKRLDTLRAMLDDTPPTRMCR